MSNDYQSASKSFPDNHISPAFTTDEKQKHKPELALDLGLIKGESPLDEEIDALALLEASSRPTVNVSSPTMTAPSLPSSPVLPSFPELSARTEPVVSQARTMPDLATIPSLEPSPSVSTGTTPSVEQRANPNPPTATPVKNNQNSTPSSTTEGATSGTARVVSQASPQASHHASASESPLSATRTLGMGSSTNKGKLGEGNKDAVVLDEPAVNVLQKVINAYNQLEQSIASNKVELEAAHDKLQTIKEKKHTLEVRLHEITPQGFPVSMQQALTGNKETVLELDSLYHDVKESKMNTQNRSCDTVIEYTKSIRKHIVSDSQKAEEFLRPLSLSCEILKTNIQHVRALEQVVDLMEVKKSLTQKRNDVHKTISLLMGQIT